MLEIALNILAIAWAYWYGRYRRERRARDVWFGRITVFDHRSCPACGIIVTGSPLDVQAHELQHLVRVER